MTMNAELLRAILAMDAYNRGYGEGVLGLGTSAIGDATFLRDANDQEGLAQAIGFYAAAYTLTDGSTVISYRGTDSLNGAKCLC